MSDVGTLLAIDTSGATASVAVYHDQVLAEAVWQSGRSHSAQLIPMMDVLMKLARTERSDLAAIAVASGPGSYSGLRVGVSTAMGLALALGIGVVQVPTLDVIAWAQSGASSGDGKPSRPIRAAIEVGRGHYGTARFRHVGQQLERETRIETVGLGELLEQVSAERSVLAVDLDRQAQEQIERQYGSRLDLVSPAASARRAGFLAELAAVRLRRGEPTSGSVEPIYLH